MSNNEKFSALREQMIVFIIRTIRNLDNSKLSNVYHFVQNIK